MSRAGDGTRAGGASRERFDLQDCLIVGGFICLVTGVGVIYWPAALILAGLLFFAAVWLIELAKRPGPQKKEMPPRMPEREVPMPRGDESRGF